MALGLRLRVKSGVAAELIERLLTDSKRAAVGDRAGDDDQAAAEKAERTAAPKSRPARVSVAKAAGA